MAPRVPSVTPKENPTYPVTPETGIRKPEVSPFDLNTETVSKPAMISKPYVADTNLTPAKIELPSNIYACDLVQIGIPIELTRGKITAIPLVGYEVKKRKLVSTNMAHRGLQVINPVLAPGDHDVYVIWLDKFSEDAIFKMAPGDLQIKLHD
jgi:hypothetical protein